MIVYCNTLQSLPLAPVHLLYHLAWRMTLTANQFWKPLYLARRVQWEMGSQCRDHPDCHPQTLGLSLWNINSFCPVAKLLAVCTRNRKQFKAWEENFFRQNLAPSLKKPLNIDWRRWQRVAQQRAPGHLEYLQVGFGWVELVQIKRPVHSEWLWFTKVHCRAALFVKLKAIFHFIPWE